MSLLENLFGKRVVKLPPGQFKAPIFILDKRENHGHGYHIHVLKLFSGKYLRTNAALTKKNNKVYLFFHNENNTIDIGRISKTLTLDLIHDVGNKFKGIPDSEWRPFDKDEVIFLFSIKN